MEAEIASQNKTQSALRQETESLKKNAKELEDHIANLSIALGETQAEERRLSKLVVHSPERVKADLAATSQTLEDVKRDIEEKQREKALVQKQTEHASPAEESLRRTMIEMETMETKRQQFELVAEESDAAKQRLEDANRRLKERKHEREEQDRELEALDTTVPCANGSFVVLILLYGCGSNHLRTCMFLHNHILQKNKTQTPPLPSLPPARQPKRSWMRYSVV